MLGLNSGMDTESIVNAILQPYQDKIDVQKKKQTKLEWKQEAWKDLNTKISSFFNNYVSKLKMSTTYKGNKITNTNESVIRVNADNSVVPTGVHKFTVSQLAATGFTQNARMTKDTILESKKVLNENAGTLTLGDLGLSQTSTIKLLKKDTDGNDIGTGTTIEMTQDMTVEDLQRELSSYNIELNIDDQKGSFSLEYTGTEMQDKESLKISMESGDTGFLGDIGLSSVTFNKSTTAKQGKGLNDFSKSTTLARLGIGTGTITLNGTPIEIKGDMKLSELESKLKSADSKLNVSLDIGQGRFYISTKDTGSANSIKISGDESLLESLGLKHIIASGGTETVVGEVTTYTYADGTKVSKNATTGEIEIMGADAKYNYNGLDYESASNNISVNNINATLLSTTPSGTAANITASNDPTEVSKFLKEFVDGYNSLIEEINTMLTTKPVKKYEPLTDAEKEKMDEDQIEKWEKLAKKGLFYADSDLSSIRDTMRDILGSGVSGSKTGTLYSIGITTGAWSENGKLHFDEEIFAKAYEENAEDIIKMLTGSGSEAAAEAAYLKKNPGGDYNTASDADKAKYYNNTKGIAYRLYESMNKLIYSSSLNKSYGNIYNDKTFSKEVTSIKDRVDELQDRFDRMETLYYKKFTAMEKALSSMNTQQNWLASALG